MRVIH